MKKFMKETIADPVADLDTDTQLYRDRKYVRMAGNPSKATCHEGIRIALDIIDRCAPMLSKVA